MTRRAAAFATTLATAVAGVVLTAAPAAAAAPFPDVIPLPPSFQPEGIATGTGTTFYVGSIPTGAVLAGDYRTGVVEPLVPARSGRAAIGLKADRGLLWVAGGPTGKAFVYDARTGADVAQYALTSGATFVNDVVLTREAAYFTDSVNPVLYRIARGPGGAPGALTVIPLTGDLVYASGFNVNGIAATPDGSTLYVVQSNTGSVYSVDPATGVTTRLTPNSTVPNGDGILLDGRTLYVVQNRVNLVAALDAATGAVLTRVTDGDFKVPTTIAEFGSSLYAVNAQFGTAPADADYAVVRIAKP